MACCIGRANTASPYAGLIIDALVACFPTTKVKATRTIDAVVEALISTKQLRHGPVPVSESYERIRAIVAHWVGQNQPIPLLCPLGSKKPNNESSVDVAELSGFKTLLALRATVQGVYAPGITIVLRIEDINPFYLFRDEGIDAVTASKRYIKDLELLANVLGLPSFCRIRKDSDFVTPDDFVKRAEAATMLLLEYIDDTDNGNFDTFEELDSWKRLTQIGWRGRIPTEQRDHYRRRYERLYGCDRVRQNQKLAEYLASSLVRYQVNGTAQDESWGNEFLYMNFCPPIPGAPKAMSGNRLYYRTVPYSHCGNHMPAWRGKGIVRISEGKASLAVVSWQNTTEFNSFEATLSGGGSEVVIRADYSA